jgi:hypothetical protein
MSPEEIYSVARYVGFPPAAAVSMVAIALKESGGNPQAYNGTPPDDSYGLWQINMYGALGPDRRRRYNLTANSDLFDPYVNGRAMMAILRGIGPSIAATIAIAIWRICPGRKRRRQTWMAVRLAAAARTSQLPCGLRPILLSWWIRGRCSSTMTMRTVFGCCWLWWSRQ